MKKPEQIAHLIRQLKDSAFTGFIRINFSQGGITEIEKNEKILKKTLHQEK